MINLEYQGNLISQRADGYVNLSEMAKANNVRLDNWLANESTTKYLEALVQVISLEFQVNGNLIDIRGFGANKASWGHPLVAIAFGQWISPPFHVWCNMHIRTIMQNAATEADKPKFINHRTVSLELARTIREVTDSLSDNPRLAQLLIDNALQDIKALPQEADQPILVGVVELAHQLGFKTDESSRVKLGNFIASQGFEKFREKRICNGAMREINCYVQTDSLEEAIKTFFNN